MGQAPLYIKAQTQPVSRVVNLVINYDTVSHNAASYYLMESSASHLFPDFKVSFIPHKNVLIIEFSKQSL